MNFTFCPICIAYFSVCSCAIFWSNSRSIWKCALCFQCVILFQLSERVMACRVVNRNELSKIFYAMSVSSLLKVYTLEIIICCFTFCLVFLFDLYFLVWLTFMEYNWSLHNAISIILNTTDKQTVGLMTFSVVVSLSLAIVAGAWEEEKGKGWVGLWEEEAVEQTKSQSWEGCSG